VLFEKEIKMEWVDKVKFSLPTPFTRIGGMEIHTHSFVISAV
jgi:hypothetical protein